MAACPNGTCRVVENNSGGWHYENGDVWDDIRESYFCLTHDRELSVQELSQYVAQRRDARIARMKRAVEGLECGAIQVSPYTEGRWVVYSSNGEGEKEYVVEKRSSKYVCTCPDYQKRGGECKHIFAVKLEWG